MCVGKEKLAAKEWCLVFKNEIGSKEKVMQERKKSEPDRGSATVSAMRIKERRGEDQGIGCSDSIFHGIDSEIQIVLH